MGFSVWVIDCFGLSTDVKADEAKKGDSMSSRVCGQFIAFLKKRYAFEEFKKELDAEYVSFDKVLSSLKEKHLESLSLFKNKQILFYDDAVTDIDWGEVDEEWRRELGGGR